MNFILDYPVQAMIMLLTGVVIGIGSTFMIRMPKVEDRARRYVTLMNGEEVGYVDSHPYEEALVTPRKRNYDL